MIFLTFLVSWACNDAWEEKIVKAVLFLFESTFFEELNFKINRETNNKIIRYFMIKTKDLLSSIYLDDN